MNSINKSIGLVLVMALMLVPATRFLPKDGCGATENFPTGT